MFGFVTTGMLEGIELSRRVPKSVRKKWNRRRWHQRIYWRDNGVCAYCDRKVPYEKSTIDHIQPLIRGGSDKSKENMALSCESCNRAKGPLEMDLTEHSDLSLAMLQRKWISLDKAVR